MRRRSLIGYLGSGLAGLAASAGLSRRIEGAEAGPNTPNRNPIVPTHLFISTGMGVHEREIQASDMALYNAGIGNYNRDRVSSIVPPGCKVITMEEGVKYLKEGQVLFCVLPTVVSNIPGTAIASGIATAIPEDGDMGTIAEVYEEASEIKTAEQAARRAVEMALGLHALRLKINYDPTKEFDPARKVYQVGPKAIRVHSGGKAAVVGPEGKFTSVVAALTFLV
jgi:arginine decarboxylase